VHTGSVALADEVAQQLPLAHLQSRMQEWNNRKNKALVCNVDIQKFLGDIPTRKIV
jgi:hypothetical protein